MVNRNNWTIINPLNQILTIMRSRKTEDFKRPKAWFDDTATAATAATAATIVPDDDVPSEGNGLTSSDEDQKQPGGMVINPREGELNDLTGLYIDYSHFKGLINPWIRIFLI